MLFKNKQKKKMLWDVLQIIQEYPASLVTFEDVNEDTGKKFHESQSFFRDWS